LRKAKCPTGSPKGASPPRLRHEWIASFYRFLYFLDEALPTKRLLNGTLFFLRITARWGSQECPGIVWDVIPATGWLIWAPERPPGRWFKSIPRYSFSYGIFHFHVRDFLEPKQLKAGCRVLHGHE